jgi:hypothetical protein
MNFCTPNLQKSPKYRSISLILRFLEFLHHRCFLEGKNPPENRDLEKINVKQFYCLQVGMFERGVRSQEPGERLK